MKKTLITASTIALLAGAPVHAQGTLGAAVDKLATDAIGGMTMGDHATNEFMVERSQPAADTGVFFVTTSRQR